MSLFNNSPTISYIQATGVSVIYQDKMYTVYDFNTDKQFIYWNIETPNVFRASNTRPETFPGQRIVLINDNGTAKEVPNEDLQVFFDGNSIQNIRNRIFGLYEKNEEFEDKFATIEINIDGITTTVGKLQEEDRKIHEHISAINQRADEIDLSVKEVTKEFKDTELRDKLNGVIIKLASDLGLFKGAFTDYAKDNKITTDEKNEINAHIEALVKSKKNVFDMVETVLKIAVDKGLTQEKTQITNAKNALENAHNHLINNMRNVISDGVITPTDRTVIIDAFAKYTLRVNELKNVLENVILLGMGGSIIEQFSNINMRSDKIEQEVAVVENGVKQNSSKITQTATDIRQEVSNHVKGLNSKIEQTSNSITSSVTDIKNNLQSQISQNARNINLKVSKDNIVSEINMSPERIKISADKLHLEGYATFTSLKTPGMTVIDGGNIKTNTIDAHHIKANTIKAEHIYGKHFYGVSVTTVAESGYAKAVLTGDGINFYSPFAHAGKVSYDSGGSGSSDNARDRLWLRSLGGYALKLQSSGDMSIEANGGYTNMWLKANKVAFNIGSGGFWINNKLIDFNNLNAVAKFG